jgi:hypothetical protein
MDKTLSILGYAVVLLGMATIYIPLVQLSDNKRLSSKELSTKYPEHKWISSSFFRMYIGWIVLVLIVLFSLSPWANFANFVSVLFASMALFFGLFIVFTGVSILPTRDALRFYVVGDKTAKVGWLQVISSLIVIIIAFLLEVLH